MLLQPWAVVWFDAVAVFAPSAAVLGGGIYAESSGIMILGRQALHIPDADLYPDSPNGINVWVRGNWTGDPRVVEPTAEQETGSNRGYNLTMLRLFDPSWGRREVVLPRLIRISNNTAVSGGGLYITSSAQVRACARR